MASLAFTCGSDGTFSCVMTLQGSFAELQQQHAGLQQHSQALESETSEQSQTIAGLNKLKGDQHDEINALMRLDEERVQRIAELETCNSELQASL